MVTWSFIFRCWNAAARSFGILLVPVLKCRITCLLFELLLCIFSSWKVQVRAQHFSNKAFSVPWKSTSNSFGLLELMWCPISVDSIYLYWLTIIVLSSLLALGSCAVAKASSGSKFVTTNCVWYFTSLRLLPVSSDSLILGWSWLSAWPAIFLPVSFGFKNTSNSSVSSFFWFAESFDAGFMNGYWYFNFSSFKKFWVTEIKLLIWIGFRMTWSRSSIVMFSKWNMFFSTFVDFSLLPIFRSFSIDWGTRTTVAFLNFSSNTRFNVSASSLSRFSPSYSSTNILTFLVSVSWSISFISSLNFLPPSLRWILALGILSRSVSNAVLES